MAQIGAIEASCVDVGPAPFPEGIVGEVGELAGGSLLLGSCDDASASGAAPPHRVAASETDWP